MFLLDRSYTVERTVPIPRSVTFTNNIFHNLGSGDFDFATSEDVQFDNNLFFGGAAPAATATADVTLTNSINADPRLVAPGSGGSHIDFNDDGRLSGYLLEKDSPAIDAGAVVADNGGRDFWGNALYTGSPDVGAFESPSVPVESILVRPASPHAPASISRNGGSLKLRAVVSPDDAANSAVEWSVHAANGVDPTHKARVNQNGVLTAIADGLVIVRATALDGSGASGEIAVRITKQRGCPTPTNPHGHWRWQ